MLHKFSAWRIDHCLTGCNCRAIPVLVMIMLVLSVTTACQVTPSKKRAPEYSEQTVDQLIQDKEPAEAIALLDSMALKSNRSKAFDFMLKAAELSIEAENTANVDRRLDQLNTLYPEKEKYVQISILRARVALARKDPDSALKTLQSITSSAKGNERLDILDLKASALAQAGFPFEGVRVRIELDRQLQISGPDADRIQHNDRETWKNLMQVRPELITEQISEIPDIFSGWLELAALTNSYQYDNARLDQEIDNWSLRHPGHPASRQIVETIRLRQIATSQHPEHIALVLPLSGKLAQAGKTIRDGFLTAYLESAAAIGMNIKIDIHDTAGQPDIAAFAVQQANQAGAKFIVGPLDKDAVGAVANLKGISSKILVLNQIPVDLFDQPDVAVATPEQSEETSTVPDQNAEQVPPATLTDDIPDIDPIIYQFSLAPEDEASQVARRAGQDQHFNAMAIVPENVWGNRIFEAFAESYSNIGGEVVSKQTYKKGSADHSSAIQNGLNLTNSKIRYQQLKGFLPGEIEFTPRRRQDIDMIFLIAHAQDARQIKPQLGFYYAGDIPVYSTSHVFTGIASATKDKDLEDIQFCDMPWILNSGQDASSAAFEVLAGKNRQFIRLYALGIDAFRLIPHLPWLEEHPGDWIPGQTGRLSLEEDLSVRREVSWSRFVGGIPARSTLTGPL
jgi:outer membrane PBP1 activator LpoA protein